MADLGAGVNRISASVRETASLCGVARGTVEHWIREGLPCVRIGRKRLICMDSLQAWLKGHEATEDQHDAVVDRIVLEVLRDR